MAIDTSRIYDVLVLGGGNAALCAAIMAREAGASVILVECAPVHFRGGNSRHTRNIRSMHEAVVGFAAGGATDASARIIAKACAAAGRDRVEQLGAPSARGCGDRSGVEIETGAARPQKMIIRG